MTKSTFGLNKQQKEKKNMEKYNTILIFEYLILESKTFCSDHYNFSSHLE